MPAPKAPESLTYEAALAELEQIVQQMEDGQLPLEEALDLFERGMTLARRCRERLLAAEQRIEIILKSADGSVTTAPLAPTGDDADDE
ncbi:exodeoxyribonuclease VII small subunit [Chloracidobacterium aggregatum]|jgi:exodeoxyribonuclease VII small subunit|uniref:Exodeoxyribonuclease 7 small subunit n=1 Tax=Chloracidobacterium sp. N TaxID=2821540 RepID=A0ABX8B0Y3_9BACT|nr:exodeoxyribonuclease VII small subunit [Chloracidobacterium aggregatum]QUV85579.1 exodeoxyribonuclease VII small subunit [Chloracidobacterium sp. 2]QUV88018.1 exodeoxyribonuclease VII small subunit [Chloracidobacterium sp. S]QUV90938.1 exodeoxyribonuclease VII small subunit [Chloracidobacterium sp. A]QUV94128.1 exodeoxyribonuclease VII small subunit [Chloracidobacterium sp. N]QUV97326.1 exodeoxyribonuclease VII small subunit [Chloracidobacterium sp. E]